MIGGLTRIRRPGGRAPDDRSRDRTASSSDCPSRTACRAGSAREELDHYIAEFTRTGFTGGLNWYRNLDRNWEIMADPPAATIAVPAHVHRRHRRPRAEFHAPRPRRRVVTGPYREVMIEGAGHWLQQERPDEINEVLLDFLSGLKTSA